MIVFTLLSGVMLQRMKAMFNLQDYRKEKQAIENDKRYSDMGKRDALSTFERRHEEAARKAIKSLRRDAIVNGLKWRDAQAKRIKEYNETMANIDYGRLNYETQGLQSKIKRANSIMDVFDVWESVKNSGDPYVIKAWKDVSPGLVDEKFGEDYADMKGQLFDDIDQSKAEFAKVEITEDELKAREALKNIEAEAKDINEVFGSGGSVIKRVFDKISFNNGNIELAFDYEIHKLSDKQETPNEVAYRLERERDKAIEEYRAVIGSKSFNTVFDADFDDLSGLL